MLAATKRMTGAWRRRGAPLAGAVCVAMLAAAYPAAHAGADYSAGEIQGFSTTAAAAEAQLEQRFDADLSAAELRSLIGLKSPTGSV